MITALVLMLVFLALDFIDKELIKDKSKIIWLVTLLGAIVILIITIDTDNELFSLISAVIIGYSAVCMVYKNKRDSPSK